MTVENKTLVSVRIYHEDTDSGGVVYHANYLRYMERARTEWLRDRGFDHDRVAREAGILFVVRSVEIKFLRPARLSDLLVASAELVKINHGLMVFDQRIMNHDVELARATVRVISVSVSDFKSVGLSDQLKQDLGVNL